MAVLPIPSTFAFQPVVASVRPVIQRDLSPSFPKSLSHDTFHPVISKGSFQYQMDKLYNNGQPLNLGQKIATALIHGYQAVTRATLYKLLGNPCDYMHHGALSCSEFTLIAIQQYGALQGIRLGAARMLGITEYSDPFERAMLQRLQA